MAQDPMEATPVAELKAHYAAQPLKGQVALVTGANSGLGAGMVNHLAAAGAAVVINYVVKPEAAEAMVAEITAAGGKALAVQADVSNEAQVQAMFQQAVAQFGTVDILINNAGLERNAPFHEMTIDQWNLVIAVNLTGQFLCAREAIREFRRRGLKPDVSRSVGKIVCISSVHEIIPWAGHVNYAASKGGVMLMMKSLAQEYAPKGIRVNSIAPGAIKTPINRQAWDTKQAEDALLTLIPSDRVGTVDDIGKTAVWLSSDDADYINGVSIVVDGGMTLYEAFASGG